MAEEEFKILLTVT